MINVSFSKHSNSNKRRSGIVIQTKRTFQDEKWWKTLPNCDRDQKSIQCEIDDDLTRLFLFFLSSKAA